MINSVARLWDIYILKIEGVLAYEKTSKVFSYLLFALVFVNAWQSDDAYISFRAVDNFVNGHGLVYNVGERVQAFSNPLLVLLLIPLHYIGSFIDAKTIYFSSLLFSFAHVVLVVQLLKRIATSHKAFTISLLMVIVNISIVDYFTSGLENSLNYVLVLWSILLLKQRDFLLLAFVLSLLLISRLDLLVFVLPIFIYSFVQLKTEKERISFSLIFGIPIGIWLCFALVYYGSLLPNSMTAKSAFQPSYLSLLINDFRYLVYSTHFHPLAFIMPIIIALFITKKLSFGLWQFYIALGAFLYLIMPFGVGGDFMAGRFQTVPSLALIALWSTFSAQNVRLRLNIMALFLIVFTFHGGSYLNQPFKIRSVKYIKRGVTDEKLWYFRHTSLLSLAYKKVVWNRLDGNHVYQFSENKIDTDSTTFFLVAGQRPFRDGVESYNTDKIGLVDPLLSRLPSVNEDYWRPGHAIKNYPLGYINSLRSGENRIKDPKIKALYDDVLLAARSKQFFTKERWLAIWRLNTGFHKIERGYAFTTNHPSLQKQ